MHRVLRDVRPEHEEGGVRDEEIERDVEDEHPDPGLLDERAPALPELAEEARAGPGDRLDVDLREEKRARPVRPGVDQQRRPRADECDDRTADGRAERERRVARDREQPVRLLEQLLRHDLPHEPVRRRRVEGDRRASARLECDQLPDVGVAGEEKRAHRRAHRGARDVGADHDDAPRQAVAEDAAEGEHRHRRQRPGGEAEADRRRAAAVVEDRERDRDRSEVCPDVRDRAGGEEQAERGQPERPGHARARFSAQRLSPAYDCQSGIARS